MSISMSVCQVYGKTWFSSLIIKEHLQYIFLYTFCPSVCRSGYKRQKCRYTEKWFSRLLFTMKAWFFFCVNIYQMNAHLHSIDMLSLCHNVKIFANCGKVLWYFFSFAHDFQLSVFHICFFFGKVLGSMIGPNRIIATDIKSCT